MDLSRGWPGSRVAQSHAVSQQRQVVGGIWGRGVERTPAAGRQRGRRLVKAEKLPDCTTRPWAGQAAAPVRRGRVSSNSRPASHLLGSEYDESRLLALRSNTPGPGSEALGHAVVGSAHSQRLWPKQPQECVRPADAGQQREKKREECRFGGWAETLVCPLLFLLSSRARVLGTRTSLLHYPSSSSLLNCPLQAGIIHKPSLTTLCMTPLQPKPGMLPLLA